MPQSSLFLSRVSWFSWINAFCIIANLRLISSYEKFYVDIFCQCSCCFYGGKDFLVFTLLFWTYLCSLKVIRSFLPFSFFQVIFPLPIWFRFHPLCWGIFLNIPFITLKSRGLRSLFDAFSVFISSFNHDLHCRIIWLDIWNLRRGR